eukprot:2558634-Ditylum_brightwellii.AAC.1
MISKAVQWSMTFLEDKGNIAELECAPIASVTTISNGTSGNASDDGWFNIYYGSEKSSKIPFNATPDELKTALESFVSIGNGGVKVSWEDEEYPDRNGGRS